jgi:CheY-like chemotaxis protein
MKKILLIEDDQIVANVYRNKLAIEGYKAEVASDGEAGLKILADFRPDLIILDLMLPTISGVDVIKQIRGLNDFTKTPVIVFSNTYLTNLIQDAWRAGASKCLSKANCSPKDFIEIVRQTIGNSGAMTQMQTGPVTTPQVVKPATLTSENDAEFQAGLRKTFIESLPATLATLRSCLQNLVKGANEMERLKLVYELYRRVHALNGNAGLAGMAQIAHMASAGEALLKELYEKPKNINASTIRTVAAAVDFLGILFERSTLPDKQEPLISKILVVDDEAISRRAVVYALEKARLKSIAVEDPEQAL